MNTGLTPSQKAQRTAKWARTMTKWLITKWGRANVRWQFVQFGGVTGSESRGIVDMLAIRRDHKTANHPMKKGDLFDIILVQIKGGTAKRPTNADVDRLISVAEHYKARAVVLAEWKKGTEPILHRLIGRAWEEASAAQIFQ